MNEKEVFDALIDIIGEFVDEPAALAEASSESDIIKDLRVNSARLVDIIIKTEDMFDIEIDDDDADVIRTIGDAVSVVLSKTGAVKANV